MLQNDPNQIFPMNLVLSDIDEYMYITPQSNHRRTVSAAGIREAMKDLDIETHRYTIMRYKERLSLRHCMTALCKTESEIEALDEKLHATLKKPNNAKLIWYVPETEYADIKHENDILVERMRQMSLHLTDIIQNNASPDTVPNNLKEYAAEIYLREKFYASKIHVLRKENALGDRMVNTLYDHGYRTLRDLIDAPDDIFTRTPGIGRQTILKLNKYMSDNNIDKKFRMKL